MKGKEFTDLTQQELTIEEKKRKGIYIAFSALIGLMVGVSVYEFVKYGFTFFTVMPLMFFPIYLINWKNYKAAKNEIKLRNINNNGIKLY